MSKDYSLRKSHWYEMEDALMEKHKEEEESWRWETRGKTTSWKLTAIT